MLEDVLITSRLISTAREGYHELGIISFWWEKGEGGWQNSNWMICKIPVFLLKSV